MTGSMKDRRARRRNYWQHVYTLQVSDGREWRGTIAFLRTKQININPFMGHTIIPASYFAANWLPRPICYRVWPPNKTYGGMMRCVTQEEWEEGKKRKWRQ